MTAERDSMTLNEISYSALGVEERSDEAPRAGGAVAPRRRSTGSVRLPVESRLPIQQEHQAMTWIGWTIAVIALMYAGRWLENKLERIELLLMDINDIVKDLDYLAEQGRKERLFQAERELDRL